MMQQESTLAQAERPRKPKKTRVPQDVAEQRVNELLRVMLDGAQRWDFLEYVRQREAEPDSPWYPAVDSGPLGYSQVMRYVQRAKKLIAESGQGTREQLLEMHLARREALYAKAVAAGDLRTATMILDSKAKLERLFPSETMRTPVSHPIVLVFHEEIVNKAQPTSNMEILTNATPIEHTAIEHADYQAASDSTAVLA